MTLRKRKQICCNSNGAFICPKHLIFMQAIFWGSIIFKKPFAVISNSVRGNARFDYLLSVFHLEDRMVKIATCDDIPNDTINWEEVNDIVNRERDISLKFLNNSLNENNRSN